MQGQDWGAELRPTEQCRWSLVSVSTIFLSHQPWLWPWVQKCLLDNHPCQPLVIAVCLSSSGVPGPLLYFYFWLLLSRSGWWSTAVLGTGRMQPRFHSPGSLGEATMWTRWSGMALSVEVFSFAPSPTLTAISKGREYGLSEWMNEWINLICTLLILPTRPLYSFLAWNILHIPHFPAHPIPLSTQLKYCLYMSLSWFFWKTNMMLSPLCLELLNDFPLLWIYSTNTRGTPYAKIALWFPMPGIDAGYRQDCRGSLSSSGTEQVNTNQNIPDCSPQST